MQSDCVTPGCASGMGDSTVVDPETHLPYDMCTEIAPLGASLAGTGSALNSVRLRRGVADGRA